MEIIFADVIISVRERTETFLNKLAQTIQTPTYQEIRQHLVVFSERFLDSQVDVFYDALRLCAFVRVETLNADVQFKPAVLCLIVVQSWHSASLERKKGGISFWNNRIHIQ